MPFCSKEILKKWLCINVTQTQNQDGDAYPPKTIYALLCGILREMRVTNSKYPNFIKKTNHSSTYLCVIDMWCREYSCFTISNSCFWSSTSPNTILLIQSKSRWTIFCRIRHVEVSYSHPSFIRSSQLFHVTVYMTNVSITVCNSKDRATNILAEPNRK